LIHNTAKYPGWPGFAQIRAHHWRRNDSLEKTARELADRGWGVCPPESEDWSSRTWTRKSVHGTWSQSSRGGTTMQDESVRRAGRGMSGLPRRGGRLGIARALALPGSG
jgi:hypothetical protein